MRRCKPEFLSGISAVLRLVEISSISLKLADSFIYICVDSGTVWALAADYLSSVRSSDTATSALGPPGAVFATSV